MSQDPRLAQHRLFEQLFESSPVGIAFLDRDLKYIRVNETLARYNGHPVEDHPGRRVDEILPGLSEQILDAYRRVLVSGRPVLDREIRSATPVDPDRERWWLSNYFPVRDDEGEVCGICSIVQDITARNEAETALRDRLGFEILLAELTGAFVRLSGDEVDRAIPDHLQELAEFFGADRAVLWRREQDSGVLRPVHFWHDRAVPPPPMDQSSDDYPDTSHLILSGEPYVFSGPDDFETGHGVTREYMEKQGVQSGMVVPLTIGGEVSSMIGLAAIRRRRSWNDTDLQRATILGGVFATALERRRAETELREALDRNRSLTDQLEAECMILREEVSLQGKHQEIIGDSEALRQCLFRVEQVAPTDVTVLLQGETGTGKELVARAVHRSSGRSRQPLITVNCGALPPSLIESELFGHERGAFTGADSRRVGRFEMADGGTLFLDEIGELSPDLQVKLLRVLQEGEFQRLGSSKTLKTDVRVIAATNRDLESAVADGVWREDLYYRLNVFPIAVPPLRDRKEDIPVLVEAFVARFTAKTGRSITRITQGALDRLAAYSWPGNVRELENVIERAVITSTGSTLLLADQLEPRADAPVAADLRRTLEDVEQEHLRRVLEDRKWRIEGERGAAAVLGMNPSTLRARLRKHGIRRP